MKYLTERMAYLTLQVNLIFAVPPSFVFNYVGGKKNKQTLYAFFSAQIIKAKPRLFFRVVSHFLNNHKNVKESHFH